MENFGLLYMTLFLLVQSHNPNFSYIISMAVLVNCCLKVTKQISLGKLAGQVKSGAAANDKEIKVESRIRKSQIHILRFKQSLLRFGCEMSPIGS